MFRKPLFLVVLLALDTSGGVRQEQDEPLRKRLIGTWSLVSTEDRMTDGTRRTYPYAGPRGKGYLIYTADGYMCGADESRSAVVERCGSSFPLGEGKCLRRVHHILRTLRDR